MRKIFLSLLFSFSFFFLINSVSAEERTYSDFTNLYEYNNSFKGHYWSNSLRQYIPVDIPDSYLERLISKANSKNVYYAIFFSNSSGSGIPLYYTNISICEYSEIPTIGIRSNEDYSNYVIYRSNISGNCYDFIFSTTERSETALLNYIEDIVSNYENDISTSSLSSIFSWFYFSMETNQNNTSNRKILYYSNFDFKLSNSPLGIKVGDTIYTNGDTIPTLQEYLTPTTNYTLKNAYSSADYEFNHIEFYLDTSSLVLESENVINFKLQAEANDPNNSIVPNLVSAKVYGLLNNSTDNQYELCLDTSIVTSLSYEIDATLGQYITTGSFTYSSSMFDYHSLKIDFEFENSNNGTIYVYDDFVDIDFFQPNNPRWECKRSFLYGYTRYSFPINSVMALVSSNSATNGRVYTSYNSTINEDILFKSYYYDYANDVIVGNSIVPISLIEDPYYVYYDFSLDYANDKILMLHQVTDVQNYFYLPNDFNVTFVYYHDTSYSIDTPDGNIEHDYVAHEPISTEDNGFIYSITSSFNYFIQPITYITSLISNFYNGLPIGIKYLFVSLFGLVVAMFIVKFLL